MKLKLVETVDYPWLLHFTHKHHSTMPSWLLPSTPVGMDRARWFCIFDGEDLAGITAFQKTTPKLAYVMRTILKPEFRGRSIARESWPLMEERLLKLGFTKVFCHVYTDNLPMIITRLKCGFLIEGLNRDHDAPGIHQYIFGKEIKKP